MAIHLDSHYCVFKLSLNLNMHIFVNSYRKVHKNNVFLMLFYVNDYIACHLHMDMFYDVTTIGMH